MKRKKEYATDVLKREIEERKHTKESNNCSNCIHRGITFYGDNYCRHHYHTIENKNCETCVNWDNEANWHEHKDAIEILRKENWDLKFNQSIIEQAIIQMREMFPEQWDKALDEYKRKYGLIK